MKKSSLQIQMLFPMGLFSPRPLGNERRMRSEIAKMKMISKVQTKITDGRRRTMEKYRSPRRNGREVKIS